MREFAPESCTLPSELLDHIFCYLCTRRTLEDGTRVSAHAYFTQEEVDGRAALSACARVNRQWYECAVRHLWHAPEFLSLSSFASFLRALAIAVPTYEPSFDLKIAAPIGQHAGYQGRFHTRHLSFETPISADDTLTSPISLLVTDTVLCSLATSDCSEDVHPMFPNLISFSLPCGNHLREAPLLLFLTAHTNSLQYIDLQDCRHLTNTFLEILSHLSGGRLKRLSIRRSSLITDNGIRHIAGRCVTLEDIDISGCRRVSEEALLELAHSRRWRSFQASDIKFLSREGLIRIGNELVSEPSSTAHMNSKLQTFECTIPPPTSDKSPRLCTNFAKLINTIPLTLSSLIIHDANYLAVEHISGIAKKLRGLTCLHLGCCEVLTTTTFKLLLNSLQQLRHLALPHASHLENECLGMLRHAPCAHALEYIDFSDCRSIGDHGLRLLCGSIDSGFVADKSASQPFQNVLTVKLAFNPQLSLPLIVELARSFSSLQDLDLQGGGLFITIPPRVPTRRPALLYNSVMRGPPEMLAPMTAPQTDHVQLPTENTHQAEPHRSNYWQHFIGILSRSTIQHAEPPTPENTTPPSALTAVVHHTSEPASPHLAATGAFTPSIQHLPMHPDTLLTSIAQYASLGQGSAYKNSNSAVPCRIVGVRAMDRLRRWYTG
ncbi:hypothetical protein BZG36_00566 [Bifiguratus adelaidae]|uniref:F-box domain-containing protein n=1 Tax=Bifiguratus adelaidae TaxID=1938954 RepID=A0A261Y7L3_9FUNG|nr:hypothetical protein BZG36_00566 [Bifiguratus adelaidae]